MSYEIREYGLILFDRDGTLTKPASGKQFPETVDDQMWIDGRLELLHQLNMQGVKTAIVTNQGGAAWGIFTPEQMDMQLLKQKMEGRMDGIFVCYHDTSEKARQRAKVAALTVPDLYKEWIRRKPGPGMLIEAMDHFQIDRQDTLYVGDREEDKLAAEAAGCDFEWAWSYFKDGPIIV